MPNSYDRRAADPKVNRLTPLAEQAMHDYHTAVDALERAIRVLTLIEREANGLLPKHYYKVHGHSQQPGDDLQATAEDAKSLLEEIEKRKLVPEMKSILSWVDEMASEAKARHGQ